MSKAFLATALAATILTASIGRAETFPTLEPGDGIWLRFREAHGSVVTIHSDEPGLNASVYAGPYGFIWSETEDKPGDMWDTPQVPLFCIDIYQTVTSRWKQYEVKNLWEAPIFWNYDVDMGTARADLLVELFALEVAGEGGGVSEARTTYEWATGTFNPDHPQGNDYADALTLAIWEIVFEDDLFVNGNPILTNLNLAWGEGDFYVGPQYKQSDTRDMAQGWLNQLTGSPPADRGFELYALTNPYTQDMALYCLTSNGDPPPIPEPAVVIQLLGLGAMLGAFAIRRRGLAAMRRISRSLAPTGWRGG